MGQVGLREIWRQALRLRLPSVWSLWFFYFLPFWNMVNENLPAVHIHAFPCDRLEPAVSWTSFLS